MLGRTGGVMRQTVPSWAKGSSEPGCMILECRLGNAKYVTVTIIPPCNISQMQGMWYCTARPVHSIQYLGKTMSRRQTEMTSMCIMGCVLRERCARVHPLVHNVAALTSLSFLP